MGVSRSARTEVYCPDATCVLCTGLLVASFVHYPDQRDLVMLEVLPAIITNSNCSKARLQRQTAPDGAETGDMPSLHLLSMMFLQMVQVRTFV